MSENAGPMGILFGVLVMAAGIVLQASGARAIIFSSMIGAGILLSLASGVFWLVQARGPR